MYNHKNAKANRKLRAKLAMLFQDISDRGAKKRAKKRAKLDLSEPKHSCVNNCTRLLGMAKQKLFEIKQLIG